MTLVLFVFPAKLGRNYFERSALAAAVFSINASMKNVVPSTFSFHLMQRFERAAFDEDLARTCFGALRPAFPNLFPG